MINPSHDYILRPGDIVYLLKPGATLTTNPTDVLPGGGGGGSSSAGGTGVAGIPTPSSGGGCCDLSGAIEASIIRGDDDETTSSPHSATFKTATSSQPTRFGADSMATENAPTTSHLSFDESWLEDTAFSPNSSSLFASKLNFESLKKMFLPSSIMSLSGGSSSSTGRTQKQQQQNRSSPQQAAATTSRHYRSNRHQMQDYYSPSSLHIEDEESTRLAELSQERVRSKSMAVPMMISPMTTAIMASANSPLQQYKRGKVGKQAMKKMFFNRYKLNSRRENFLADAAALNNNDIDDNNSNNNNSSNNQMKNSDENNTSI